MRDGIQSLDDTQDFMWNRENARVEEVQLGCIMENLIF